MSLLDAPGEPFWDPAADRALFDAIATGMRPGPNRKLIRLPCNVNDAAFADALVAAFDEITAVRPAGLVARGG